MNKFEIGTCLSIDYEKLGREQGLTGCSRADYAVKQAGCGTTNRLLVVGTTQTHYVLQEMNPTYTQKYYGEFANVESAYKRYFAADALGKEIFVGDMIAQSGGKGELFIGLVYEIGKPTHCAQNLRTEHAVKFTSTDGRKHVSLYPAGRVIV